jgi:S-adenosylmethionine hydrolase
VGLTAIATIPGFFAREGDDAVLGLVAAVDRFGNLRTNLDGRWMQRGRLVLGEGDAETEIQERTRTYAEASGRGPLAYVGSAGTIEVAVPGGSAAAVTGLTVGAAARVIL